jgi:adenylate kinase
LCDLDGSKLLTRDDDREEIIAGRLGAYENQTRPLIEYYRGRHRLVPVNADRSVAEVTTQVFDVIDNHRDGCRPSAE